MKNKFNVLKILFFCLLGINLAFLFFSAILFVLLLNKEIVMGRGVYITIIIFMSIDLIFAFIYLLLTMIKRSRKE